MQMKKSLVLAAGLLVLASCSNDDFDGIAKGGDATVTISATLPTDISSRAYSDGLTATHMDYAVYESGVDTPVIEGTGTFVDRQTTLTLQLVNGKSYEVIFWAQKEGAPYTWDSSTKTVTVDYTDAKLNDEDRDAFFSKESFTVEGSTTVTSTLKRPFAQINVGTNDIDKAGLADKYISATMSVTDVYSVFNLSTGAVDGNKVNVNFTETLRPNQGLTTASGDYEAFPVGDKGDYEYLAMAYVLVGADKQTTDVDLAFYDSGTKFHDLSVPGAPVQRNYRTNIFGALLTSTVDFTINIKPIYESEDDYNLNIVWDGKTTSAPSKNADGAWLITTPAELAYVAEQVNSGATTYIDETLLLENDLDLGNKPWTPIGGYGNYFKGMFNGQDHTISNLYIKKNDGSDGALFGHIAWSHYKATEDQNPPVVKNLKVDNVYIDTRVSSWSSENSNGWSTGSGAAGAIVAKSDEYTFIENCHVNNAIIYANHYAGGIGGQIKSGLKNCSATNVTVTVVPGLDPNGVQDFGDKAGALAGQLAGTSYYAVVTGNTASNFTITGFRDLGGAFGYAHISFDETGGKYGKLASNTVSNGSVNQSYEGYYEDSKLDKVGAFCGRPDGFTLDSSNTATDVEVNLVATTSDALAQAIANAPSGSTIKLAAGSYTLPVNGWPSGELTIDGQGVAKIDDVLYPSKAGSLAWTNTEIHFVNLEMDWSSRNYRSTPNAGMYIDNCKIAGTVFCNGPKTVITNCSFDSATPYTTTKIYSLYTWNCADVTVENCTFKTAWAKSILGYYTSATSVDLKVSNCNFTSTSSMDWASAHAAIELHTEKGLTGTLTIDNCKAYGDYKSLWYEVWNADDEPATDYFKVVVDGVTVQEGK